MSKLLEIIGLFTVIAVIELITFSLEVILHEDTVVHIILNSLIFTALIVDILYLTNK